jgi:hypothetical protein
MQLRSGGPIRHTEAMGATYEDDDWAKDLTDEPADELDDDHEESWLLDDEPLDADEPESPLSA